MEGEAKAEELRNQNTGGIICIHVEIFKAYEGLVLERLNVVWGSMGDEVRGWCTVGSQSMSFSHFICLAFVQGAGASPSVASRAELPAGS